MCVQVNHSPSFTTDSQLDREVKDTLLYDTLALINLGACDRRKITKEERRRVKDRLQQNRSREARYDPVRLKWRVNVFPRSYIHWCILSVDIQYAGDCYCVCVFYHQVRGAASVPGSHDGADGAVRSQTPGRLQEDLSQRGRREIRQIL